VGRHCCRNPLCEEPTRRVAVSASHPRGEDPETLRGAFVAIIWRQGKESPRADPPLYVGRLTVTDALIRKLESDNTLLPTDRARLKAAIAAIVSYPARHDVARDDEFPHNVHFVVEGFACRYKILPEGRRAILAFVLPGDFCDFDSVVLGRMDHAVATI